MVRWSGEYQVNVKSQSELEIGGRETCLLFRLLFTSSPFFFYDDLVALPFTHLQFPVSRQIAKVRKKEIG